MLKLNTVCLCLCSQKVNDSGMEQPTGPPPVTDIQDKPGRVVRPEAPVDSMLKDMATIIFSTFLLAGWVAFVIIYPKVLVTGLPATAEHLSL